jgi:hypothetical protein
VVQAGRGRTRLSDISLYQPVQGFREVSKKLDISKIWTADGRKGYLQSILIYYIHCLSTLATQEGEHLPGIYSISILLVCCALCLALFMKWQGCDTLNTQHTSDPDAW